MTVAFIFCLVEQKCHDSARYLHLFKQNCDIELFDDGLLFQTNKGHRIV